MGKINASYEVRQRVDITLNSGEVEHALRMWLLDRPHLPQPKTLTDVTVHVFADQDGLSLSATLTYEPASPGNPGDPA